MNLKNSVQLIGYLGRNPALKTLESGKKLAKTTIATNEAYKNAKGEKVINTQWHNLIAWGKTAELMEKLLQKGSEVCVKGKLTHKSYEDNDGKTRYFSEVVVNEFFVFTGKPRS